jgi:hypothetical protein
MKAFAVWLSVIISMLLRSARGQLGAPKKKASNEDLPLDAGPRRRDQSLPNLYPENWPFMSHCLDPASPGGFLDTTLRACQDSEESDIRKSDRIAIVGAGPAGVSMAYLLKKRGFDHITIFEKEDRVGGKSKSYTYNGDKFDAGTIYAFNKYECVELLFDEFGITEVAIDGAKKPRFVSDPAIFADMPNNINIYPLWSQEYTTATYGVPFDDLTAYFTQVGVEAQQYINSWMESMGSFEYYFPDESTINFDLLNVSFLEWLEGRGLYALIPRLHIAVSGQGFGSLGEIPAFYGLMWLHPNIFVGSGTFSVVQEDWQTLWERVLESLDIEVVLEASISKIERNGNIRNILYREGGSAINKRAMRSQKFDHLIMAMPMPDGLDLLDATDDEIELFSRYNYKNARLDLIVEKDAGILASGALAPFDVELFSWIGRVDQQTDYHVKSFDPLTRETSRYQWATDGVDGLLGIQRQALIKQRDSNKDVCSLWSIGSLGEDTDNVTPEAVADLTSLGIDFEHIYTNKIPDYFPWKNLTDVIDERVPWKIWDNQGGDLRTWFVGSYASMESVADVLDYNLKLVNERLCV